MTRILLLLFITSFSYAAESNPNSNLGCHFDQDKDWKEKLLVYHFYVGQGDATFIRTPKGTTVLIDAGLPSNGKKIVAKLQACGITSLDYAVITHPHNDHYGGFADIMKSGLTKVSKNKPGPPLIPITKKLLIAAEWEDTGKRTEGAWHNLKTALKKHLGDKLLIPKLGDKEISDEDVVFNIVAARGQVLGAPEGHVVEDVFKKNTKDIPDDSNAVSIAMVITYKNFSYWAGGDLTGGGTGKKGGKPDVESVVAKHAYLEPVDVFHSNHHGSETSNNAALLKILQPKTSVISVGKGGMNGNNKKPKPAGYHLPDYFVLRRMIDIGKTEKLFLTYKGETQTEDNKKGIDITQDISVDYNDEKGNKQSIQDTSMKKFIVDLNENDILLSTDGNSFEFMGKGISTHKFSAK